MHDYPAKRNLHQLVMRKDTSSDLVRVGWAEDLPLGRFVQIKLVAETTQCSPMDANNPLYDDYQQACIEATQINQRLISAQQTRLNHKGWIRVDIDKLQHKPDLIWQADELGSFRSMAMRLFYLLTHNHQFVWCVIENNQVVLVKSRQAPRPMDELEYQVWKHNTLSQLQRLSGTTKLGRLFVEDSGLWFEADPFRQ